jgi:hypothetical protein
VTVAGSAPDRAHDTARGPRIAVVADDLIWATRLEALVRAAGARPARVRDMAGLERLLAEADGPAGAFVDLTSRAYDGVAAIALAAGHVPVLAVAQHDDAALRARERDAGAGRVVPYAKMHEDGPRVVATWLRSIHVPPGDRA